MKIPFKKHLQKVLLIDKLFHIQKLPLKKWSQNVFKIN